MPDGTPRARAGTERWSIAWNGRELELDAADGGRITRFAFDGQSVLIGRDEGTASHGTSFWPSPQSDWEWPPPAEFDREPWTAAIERGALVLRSRPSRALGLFAEQRVRADLERGSAVIELALENVGGAARRVAPWHNSRVRPRGLSFFASAAPSFPESAPLLRLAPERGVIWFRHDPEQIRVNSKAFFESSEGWLAHVEADLLFVQAFAALPRSALAPGQGQIEIYADATGTFVEIEQQGPYAELAPGARSSWTVRWAIARVPSGVAIEPGSEPLLELARSLAGSA